MNITLKWGGGENKIEGQRLLFAFTHTFTTEDPMDDNSNTFDIFNDERQFDLDIVDI